MTIRQRQIQERAMPLSAGGWGGWMSDPAAIPPPSVYNQAVSGVIVNERSMLSIMALAGCIRVIGDSISGLQVHVHREKITGIRSYDDPEVAPPDVIYSPYADIDREQGDFNLVASLLLGGNAYFHIIDRDKANHPAQVEILNPSQMKVNQIQGKRVYRIGDETAPPIPTKDIVHVPWLSLAGGLVGLNPVEIGAVGFGGAIAANEYGNRFYAQGIHPSGLLTIEKPIRQGDKNRVVAELMTAHGGLAQSHTPIVLDSNAKWMQIAVNPNTAQLLETRTFSRQEIAGFIGVPPHLIGDVSSAQIYGAGLQEMVMGFVMFCLAGYTRRIDRMYTALLPAGYYARRNESDLFKTNDQMLAAFVTALRMNSLATPNEVRKYLHLPPTDEKGADSLFAPINSAHSDFMLPGGGALTATPADANGGYNNPAPLPPAAKPAGNTPMPGDSRGFRRRIERP